MTTAALLDLERPPVASSSPRPFAPARCSTRRDTNLSSQLSLSASAALRSRNMRPRVRDRGLRPHRAPHGSSGQVMSGANYDRGTESLRATVFTQTDPQPMGAATPFESAYVYGRNNPGVYVDPSGKRGVVPGVQPVDGVPEVLALAAPAPRKEKCGTYDRKKAVEYARKYALSPNDAEYHVYTGNGGEDCTNFISQSLKAGGWTTTSVWNSKSRRGPGGPIGVVRHFPDSAAWSIANVFYNTWRNSDRAQEQKTVDGLELGDIIAADWGPNPDGRVSHNMIITGFRGRDPLLSYHSTNVLDRSFAEIQQENPGTTYHYLKLRNSWCSKG